MPPGRVDAERVMTVPRGALERVEWRWGLLRVAARSWTGQRGSSDPTCLCGGIADVAGRGQCLEFALGLLRNLQTVDKGLHGFRGDALATGQLLEFLIGLGHGIATHDRLHGFGEYFPAVVQVFSNPLNIHFQLADSLES